MAIWPYSWWLPRSLTWPKNPWKKQPLGIQLFPTGEVDERLCMKPDGSDLLGCHPSYDGELWACYVAWRTLEKIRGEKITRKITDFLASKSDIHWEFIWFQVMNLTKTADSLEYFNEWSEGGRLSTNVGNWLITPPPPQQLRGSD